MSLKAETRIFLMFLPPAPMTMPFWLSVSTTMNARIQMVFVVSWFSMKPILPFLCMCLFFASCNTGGNSPSVFSIVSYNVQNLMDASLDGTEYDEYKPSGGWTENAYNTRMKRLSEVLHDKSLR